MLTLKMKAITKTSQIIKFGGKLRLSNLCKTRRNAFSRGRGGIHFNFASSGKYSVFFFRFSSWREKEAMKTISDFKKMFPNFRQHSLYQYLHEVPMQTYTGLYFFSFSSFKSSLYPPFLHFFLSYQLFFLSFQCLLPILSFKSLFFPSHSPFSFLFSPFPSPCLLLLLLPRSTFLPFLCSLPLLSFPFCFLHPSHLRLPLLPSSSHAPFTLLSFPFVCFIPLTFLPSSLLHSPFLPPLPSPPTLAYLHTSASHSRIKGELFILREELKFNHHAFPSDVS